MTDTQVLLIHGFTGSGPWHWQQWLKTRLDEQAVPAEMPELPDPDHPVLRDWLGVLRQRLDAVASSAELVVIAHSCGSSLWLHHAATIGGRARRADRVLLVSPPGSNWRHPDVHGFMPYPEDARALRRAAGSTRLVAGTGDPYLSVYEAERLAETLRVELDVIPDGEHLNTDAGYGPWPSVLRWALYETTPLVDRYEVAAPDRAYSSPKLRPA